MCQNHVQRNDSLNKMVKNVERSERFSHQKSRFFRSGRQLPLARDQSRSERENHGFSAITSSKSIFRDIFVISVGSPSRIFRKITAAVVSGRGFSRSAKPGAPLEFLFALADRFDGASLRKSRF